MSHSNSHNLILGALLGVLAGGATLALIKTKSGRNIQKGVSKKYHEIRDNLDDFIDSLESNVKKKFEDQSEEWSEKAEEWTDKAKETLENVKEYIASFDSSDYEEVGVGLLVGGLLGAGATLLLQNSLSDRGDSFINNISSHAATWKPFIFEIQELLENRSKPRRRGEHSNKVNDTVDFALSALRLWNKLKNK